MLTTPTSSALVALRVVPVASDGIDVPVRAGLAVSAPDLDALWPDSGAVGAAWVEGLSPAAAAVALPAIVDVVS